jgi:hypothetical protein
VRNPWPHGRCCSPCQPPGQSGWQAGDRSVKQARTALDDVAEVIADLGRGATGHRGVTEYVTPQHIPFVAGGVDDAVAGSAEGRRDVGGRGEGDENGWLLVPGIGQ